MGVGVPVEVGEGDGVGVAVLEGITGVPVTLASLVWSLRTLVEQVYVQVSPTLRSGSKSFPLT